MAGAAREGDNVTDRPRCEACGAVLALNPGTLCRPCLAKRRAQVEIPDYVLALIENADEHSIELVAKLVTGRLEDADASVSGERSP